MYCNLPSNNISLEIVADIITYIGNDEVLVNNTSKMQQYVGYGDTYIKSGVTTAKMLNLIDPQKAGVRLVANPEAVKLLGRTPNKDTKLSVIRKYIQGYEPFVTFVQYCLNDNTTLQAANKVYCIYGFNNKDATFLEELFISWGISINIFKKEEDTIRLTGEISEKYRRYITEDLSLNNDMAIRLHIRDRLGEESYMFLEECDIVELVDAFAKYQAEPRDSIGAAGRAFENFLRRIAKRSDVNIDVSKKSGITQVVSIIYNGGYIHSKQNQISIGLGDIRNMSGHGIDPRDYEPWNLQSQSALAYAELVLSTIRSIYLYVDKKFFTF